MKTLQIAALAFLPLAACAQEASNDASANETVVFDESMDTASDPATTDLNMESDPQAVDQAVEEVHDQSDLGNAVATTAEDAGNAAR